MNTPNTEEVDGVRKIALVTIPLHRRMAFFPRHVKNGSFVKRARVENMVYEAARRFSPEYAGGSWAFHETSNGGWFISPDTEKPFRVVTNGLFDGALQPVAFGLVVTIAAMANLAGLYQDDESLLDNYDRLRDYAAQRGDHRAIYGALD